MYFARCGKITLIYISVVKQKVRILIDFETFLVSEGDVCEDRSQWETHHHPMNLLAHCLIEAKLPSIVDKLFE